MIIERERPRAITREAIARRRSVAATGAIARVIVTVPTTLVGRLLSHYERSAA